MTPHLRTSGEPHPQHFIQFCFFIEISLDFTSSSIQNEVIFKFGGNFIGLFLKKKNKSLLYYFNNAELKNTFLFK